MSEQSPPAGPDSEDGFAGAGGNAPVVSVGDLARRVKGTIEDAFGYVRVRGEISRPSFPGSGHCYLRLKDEDAVLDGVIWRGVLGRIGLRPEEGLEVIATGRLTTYPGRSSYQIVIDRLELAGEGALLKLLEDRRRKLAAEGLFDAERKRPLPYLPDVIGVVTSPTGAVIRDILHRLAERFPRRVLVWPVLVQGEGAAAQIAAAIAGFNALPADGWPRRPDVLIVARGGGSLEDLWAFNEEVVVRAAAASQIPLISAVGHETDTTLIDHAADRRAPTPTAAAEIAVPVRADLMARVAEDGGRLAAAARRATLGRQRDLAGLARGLPDPRRLLETAWQRLDDRAESLRKDMRADLQRRSHALGLAAGRLKDPRQRLAEQRAALRLAAQRLAAAHAARLAASRARLDRIAGRLTLAPVRRELGHARSGLPQLDGRLIRARDGALVRARDRLGRAGPLLESLSYRAVLQRGFAVVRDDAGQPVMSAAGTRSGARAWLEFRDGPGAMVPVAVTGAPGPRQPVAAAPRAARREPPPAARQDDLFGNGD
ncbi:MAG: exodeoxyribonuclease VII large subunit [Alphaproteobacteria bacterium]